jgi:hypothetical protein
MAATPQAGTVFANISPDIVGITDLTVGGGAADITNGNSVANNGSVLLYITATATDTVNVARPGEGNNEAIPVVSGSAILAGYFEPDLYGETLFYKAGAVTTHIVPVQLPIAP